jgi:hypothetical protein
MAGNSYGLHAASAATPAITVSAFSLQTIESAHIVTERFHPMMLAARSPAALTITTLAEGGPVQARLSEFGVRGWSP